MNKLESKEIRAFRQYCEFRGLETSSYEERQPPEPDILAVVADESVAYELTEAIEPTYARKLYDLYRTPQLVRSGYAALPAEEKKKLEASHHGKMIDPCFRDGVSLKDRQASLPELFEFLISISPEFGAAGLQRIEKPLEVLDHIAMSQVGWNGISWQPGAPASWINPESVLRERLVDKMTNKIYETEHPIELIVYLDREVGPAPNTGWAELLAEIASKHLAGSPFRAVWLLDNWSKSVRQLAKE